MTEPKVKCVRFTVILDQFYTDHRKKALIGIKKSWRTIDDLQNHLQQTFHLNNNIYLTIDDCLLPNSESISIINPMDSVLVHHCPDQTSQSRPSPFTLLTNAFSQAQIVSGTPSTAVTGDISSPKFDQPISKRRKHTTSENIISNEQNRQTESPSKCSKWINDVNSLDDDEINVPQSNKAQSSEVTSESLSKRKRKRKRKTKSLKTVRQQNEPYPFPTPPQSISKELFSKKNLPQDLVTEKKNRNSSHIRFDEIESKSTNVDKTIELPSTARVVRGLCTEIKLPNLESCKSVSTINTKISTVITPTDETTQFKINDSGIDLEKTYNRNDNSGMLIDEFQSESALESIRKNISNLNYKSLNGKPKEHDLLAFKIFKLSENYIPELSEFIIGLVQHVNNEDNTVTISVMAGAEQTKQPTGKFSLDLDVADNDTDDSSTVTYRFDELLEAKYVVLEN